VERKTPPNELIATKFADDKPTTREIKYQRPLCLYPNVAQYRGTGNPNDAASFVCKAPGATPPSGTN
jgi:feruloyl esterase